MKLYTASEKNTRPVRLSEETRALAFEALSGRWGSEALTHPNVSMDFIPAEEWNQMSNFDKHDAIINEIAEKAPVRIIPGEKLIGSATLGDAIGHVIPGRKDGKIVFGSVSHVTLGFARAVKIGINAMEEEIDEKLKDSTLTERQRRFELSMKNAVNAFRVWHKRYLDAAKDVSDEIYNNLKNVPFLPPTNYKEAIQSLWFCFAFTRLCGNWPGIGRIDEILGDFLEEDLASGAITLDEAREYMAHFFIKGCEWIRAEEQSGSGDAQHYQNLVIGGIDSDGQEITNEVTYLVLDVIEELAIGDYPTTVRLSENSPEKLLRRTAEVIRLGGGIVAVYNESLIIESMVNYGYSLEEARRFANDGCWEIQVPGKTNFIYSDFDSLHLLMKNTLGLGEEHRNYATYDELYTELMKNINNYVRAFINNANNGRMHRDENGKWVWNNSGLCSVVSLFTEGCVEKGCSYTEGGPVYTVISPHIGGAPDTANSLYAIKKLVFAEKKVTLPELLDILENNWDGAEELRQYVRSRYVYYGNDNEEVDAIMASLLDDFADLVKAADVDSPIRYPAGISTFGRQIEWASYRTAIPSGFKKGEILAGNTSPTPGTDVEGATAEIRSFCRPDLRKQVSGCALDVRIHPSALSGEDGVTALMALLRGFVRLGGFFMQIDSVDAATLRDAQLHPEKYKSLSVRVSGWNARFITLNSAWQKMIIERSERIF